MKRVNGWTEEQLRAREDVFDGLITKAVKLTLRPIALNLNQVIVAAGGPSISTTEASLKPVIVATSGGTITALWDGYVDHELYPYLTETFLDSAAHVLAGMESALDGSIPKITDSYAQAYLASASNRLKGIGDLVWASIQEELQAGLDDGEDMRQLATRVRKVSGVLPGRATVIARTEVHAAAEQGSLAQVQLGGFTDAECSKRWLATKDDRTRLAHRQANKQTVGITQPFIVDGEGLQFPGDPTGRADNVIQCRCTMEYLFSDDADLDDDEDDLDADLVTAANDPDWDPDEHPKGPDGRFIKKGTDEYFEAVDTLKKVNAAAQKPHQVKKALPKKYTEQNVVSQGDWVSELMDQDALAKASKPKKKQIKAHPIKINTNVIYKTEYGDGAIVAEKPGNVNYRLKWDASSGKGGKGQFLLQHQKTSGQWVTVEKFGKGAAYKNFKDQTGWTTPAMAQQEIADKIMSNYDPANIVVKTVKDSLTVDPSLGPLDLKKMSALHAKQFFSALTPEKYQGYTAKEKKALADYADADFNAGNDFALTKLMQSQVQEGYSVDEAIDPNDVTSAITSQLSKPATSVIPDPDFDAQVIASVPGMAAGIFLKWFNQVFIDANEDTDQGKGMWASLSPEAKAALRQKAKFISDIGHSSTPLFIINDVYEGTNSPTIAKIEYPDFEGMHIVATNNWFQTLTKEQYDNFEEWEQEGIWDEAVSADQEHGNPVPLAALQATTGMLSMGKATKLPPLGSMTPEDSAKWFDQLTQADYDALGSDEIIKVADEGAKLKALGYPSAFAKFIELAKAAEAANTSSPSDLDDDLGFAPAAPSTLGFFEDPLNLPNMTYTEKSGFFKELTPEKWKSYSEAQRNAAKAVANDLSNPSLAGYAQSILVLMPSSDKKAFKLPEDMNPEEFKDYVKSLPPFDDPSDLYWSTAAKLGLTEWAKSYVANQGEVNLGNVAPVQAPPVSVPDKLDVTGLSQADAHQAMHAFAVAKVKPAASIGIPQKQSNPVFKPLTKTSAAKLQEDMLQTAGKKWSNAELAAVQQYTTKEGYQTSNAILRNDQARMKMFSNPQLEKGVQRAIALQGAMTPLTENVVLHRGTGAQAFGFKTASVSTADLKKLEGKTIKDRAFVSTSVINPKGEVGFDYASKPVKVLVRAPKGTPGVYVSSATPSWSHENEFVIAAGSNFHIDEVREASPADKLAYGDGIQQVVIVTVVPDEGVPSDQIHQGDKVKTPAGTKVTPAPAPPAPPTKPIVVKPSGGLQKIKLNTKTIHSTSYAPNTLVAVRLKPVPGSSPVLERLVWNGKKFVLQVPNPSGTGFIDTEVLTKKDAYAAFKDDTNWFAPKVGVTASDPNSGFNTPGDVAQSLGLPSAAPPVQLAPAPSVKTVPQTAAEIINAYGTPPTMTSAEIDNFWKSFKTTSGFGTIMLGKPETVSFKALTYAVATWNKNHPTAPMNHLQALKVIDAKAATWSGTPNTNLWENKIVSWLKTSGGVKYAPMIIKDVTAAVQAPSSTGATPTGGKIKEALLDPYDIGTPKDGVTDFPNVTPAQAAAMHTSMRKKKPLTTDQRTAVNSYTGMGSGAVNSALRHPNGHTSASIIQQATLIQEAMAPLPTSMTLHRGTDSMGGGISNNATLEDLKKLVGQKYTDGSFFSTSVGTKAAFDNKRFQLQIEAPEGTPGIYARPISNFKNENELILAAGLHYEIIEVSERKTGQSYGVKYNIRMRVVKP